jgi:hypothetical protein
MLKQALLGTMHPTRADSAAQGLDRLREPKRQPLTRRICHATACRTAKASTHMCSCCTATAPVRSRRRASRPERTLSRVSWTVEVGLAEAAGLTDVVVLVRGFFALVGDGAGFEVVCLTLTDRLWWLTRRLSTSAACTVASGWRQCHGRLQRGLTQADEGQNQQCEPFKRE